VTGGGTQVAKFAALDKNGDGKIDTLELQEELAKDPMFAKNPTNQEKLAAMIKAADTDGDGLIDKEEFTAWYRKAKNKVDSAVSKIFLVRSYSFSPPGIGLLHWLYNKFKLLLSLAST
jgi:hypothetical protein